PKLDAGRSTKEGDLRADHDGTSPQHLASISGYATNVKIKLPALEATNCRSPRVESCRWQAPSEHSADLFCRSAPYRALGHLAVSGPPAKRAEDRSPRRKPGENLPPPPGRAP